MTKMKQMSHRWYNHVDDVALNSMMMTMTMMMIQFDGDDSSRFDGGDGGDSMAMTQVVSMMSVTRAVFCNNRKQL